jgi:AraC-like DNA-binding protein
MDDAASTAGAPMPPDCVTEPSAAPQRLATTLQFHAPEILAATLRSVDVEYASLAAGPYRASMTVMELGGLQVQRVVDAPHMTRGGIRDDRILLLLPLTPIGDTRVNGRLAGANDFVLFGPGSEVRSTAAIHLTWGAVSMSHDTAQNLGIAIPRAGDFRHARAVLAARPELATGFTEALAAGHSASIVPGGEAAAGLAEDLRHLVGSALADPLPQAGGERAVGRHLAMARCVDDYLHAHVERPIATEEISAVLAVSDRALRAAFTAVHGISLHTYLRLRRLDMVRAQLLRTRAAPGRVKAAALSHGFWHLGRFTAVYRARFGELPSQTLPG